MRIKRLELIGFKSSMERTVLEFPRGITGVVGPNGCGKSNIVDALRWVLGEQSAKHLRGRAMEDVIFAGNARYGPLGAAEVTIVMENERDRPDDAGPDPEDNEIVAALRGAPELQVTRRLYRSGESEYLINSRPCRLRDITELFLGTGVGTKAYSIIEQGRVGQIVGAKPEELRLFIEEAAGTTLYRSRKIAAERKIERTRDNLLRVSDVVRELDRQANSLRRQARGAVRYQELKGEEERLDRWLSAHRFEGLRDELDRLGRDLADLRGREAAVRLRADGGADLRDQLRGARRSGEGAVSEANRVVYEHRARVAELERERRFLEGRVEEVSRQSEELVTERDRLAARRAEQDGERAECESESARVVAALTKAAEERAGLEAAIAESENGRKAERLRAAELESQMVEQMAEQARLENERSALRHEVETSQQRSARLREESESLTTVAERLVENVTECRARLDEVLAQLREAEGGKESAAIRLSDALGRRGEAEKGVQECQEALATLSSRQQSLQELHDAFADYGDGVRSFMNNGGRERTGATAVLADLIEIDPGYERAVAAALHDRLQYVVVPDADAGLVGADYLKESGAGRASFIPTQPRVLARTGAAEAHGDNLAGHVRVRDGFDAVLDPLLSGVLVADSLEGARADWERRGGEATFVTRDGEVLESTGIVTGGSGRPLGEGILERKAELRRLAEDVAGARVSADTASGALEQVVSEADGASQLLAGLDRRLHELAVTRVSVEGELELHRQNLARTEERSQVVQAEVDGLLRDIKAGRDSLVTLEEQLVGSQDGRDDVEGERREAGRRADEFEAEWRRIGSELESVRVLEAELRQKHETCALRLRTVIATDADLESRLAALDERLARESLEAEDCRARLQEPGLCLDDAQSALTASEAELVRCSETAERGAARLESVESDLAESGRRLDELRTAANRLELRCKELSLERDAVVAGVRDRLGIAANELVAPDSHEQAVADAEEGLDPTGAQRRLEEVRSRIRKLGAVNLGAVIELEEIEARLAELTGQRDDLERSIEDLRGTISRLNRLSRQRFKETFDDVSSIFERTFPKLFRGGKASIRLTDESNLLETGVEIFVQPPGKKLGNLNLLSGGEKALTAISLIFSLFLHKPSPFCVLDEVDAPLDEANIGRFTNMVAEMSEHSQFVLITHNKRTMEQCDMLYGVTMPEPGVSRIVSVDLDSAAFAA